MNVYETPEGIDTRPAVTPPFPAAEPKYTGQNPVAIRVSFRKFRREDLTGWPSPPEYRIQRLPITDTRTNVVSAPRSATTAIAFTCTI